MAAKKNKQASGSARAKAAGKWLLLVAWYPGERELIAEAAQIQERSMTQLIRRAALAEARKIISENRKEKPKSA